jgi:hypothetical protein
VVGGKKSHPTDAIQLAYCCYYTNRKVCGVGCQVFLTNKSNIQKYIGSFQNGFKSGFGTGTLLGGSVFTGKKGDKIE